MKYSPPLRKGRLIRRYKRFLADVEVEDGATVTMHCPNTGAMTHCGGPGSVIWYSTSTNPKRKYAHTWELVEVDGHLISINSARANAIVGEALDEDRVDALHGYVSVRREVRIGEHRLDFVLEGHPGDPRRCLVEVKSVTLLHDPGVGAGSFPDAVSVRAARHLDHLTSLVDSHRCVLFFCVQHAGIRSVRAAREVDAQWADAMDRAREAGVEVIAYRAPPTPEGSNLSCSIPVAAA